MTLFRTAVARFLACCAAGFLLAAPAGAAPAQVTGNALYLQRIALPATADPDGATGRHLAGGCPGDGDRQADDRDERGKAPPYAFALDYDTTAIDGRT